MIGTGIGMGTYALSLLIKMQINYNCLQLTSFRKYSLMLICCIVKKIISADIHRKQQ